MQSIVHISHSHMKSRSEIFSSEIQSVDGEVGVIKILASWAEWLASLRHLSLKATNIAN